MIPIRRKPITVIRGSRATSAVGCFPEGTSPYGMLDMSGNVWEWTMSLWGKDFDKPDFKYPYATGDGREDVKAGKDILRVVRGGAFYDTRGIARVACRRGDDPYDWDDHFGFRVWWLLPGPPLISDCSGLWVSGSAAENGGSVFSVRYDLSKEKTVDV